MLGEGTEQSVYWLGYGFDSQQGQVISLFSKTSTHLLCHTNPLVTGDYSPRGEVAQGMKLTTPLLLGPRLRTIGSVPPNLPYAFTTCSEITSPLFFISTLCDRVDVHFGVISGSKQRHTVKFLWIRWRARRSNWFKAFSYKQSEASFTWN